MKRILVTGATGNIGKEVIKYLFDIKTTHQISAAVREIGKTPGIFSGYNALELRAFDFENKKTFKQAFTDVDTLFLLRPPHLSDVKKYIPPLLKAARESGIKRIVFLSVQGAEKSNIIPHYKIEHFIKSYNFKYIFVRPSYFMQNLTTALLPELLEERTITLPAGKARFKWVDAKNIGEVTAQLLLEFEQYENRIFEITGSENMNFKEVAHLMTTLLGVHIRYRSINPIAYYLKMKREGFKQGYALVTTLLHFLPRFEKAPKISNDYGQLTGNEPTTLNTFIKREKEVFLKMK